MTRVGVIGAGLMGTSVAQRLVAAGMQVLAYDVDATKLASLVQNGVTVAETLKRVITDCELSVVCVFNTDQVEAVVEDRGVKVHASAGINSEPTFVVTSTCDPDRLAALAKRVRGDGVRVLEMPISGTSRQVAQGDGVGLVGGDAATIARAAQVLDAICPRRHYLGAVGNGSRAKLAVNLILGLNRAALAEGLVFATRLGLDPVAFLEVARGSAAQSQVMDVKGELMVRCGYTKPQSRVDQSLKDFTLMLEQAQVSGQKLPFAEVYACMLEDCVAHGEGEWDNAAIAQAIARQRRV